MDWISDPKAWIGLLTLTILEIVLGFDNIVFISIVAGKLPPAQQRPAWRWTGWTPPDRRPTSGRAWASATCRRAAASWPG